MREAFSIVGPVRHIDFPPGKNIAFVEFVNQESVGKALGKCFTVGSLELLAEERRKPNKYNYRGNASQNGNVRNTNRGRGGYQAGRGKDRPATAGTNGKI